MKVETRIGTEHPHIGTLIKSALLMWGRSGPRRMLFVLRIALRTWRAARRRSIVENRINASIPSVLAISPTMRCNYHCEGCYSRGRATDGELSTVELDSLLGEAEAFGIPAIVVTGGEPFLRDDLMSLMTRHRKLLFVVITNGSLITGEMARRIAASGNIIALVSLEGLPDHTDTRRQHGAHDAAVCALTHLREAKAFSGFAATNTTSNSEYLGTDGFIDEMVRLGCSVGFFSEYVPCGPNTRHDWVLGEEEREAFREQVLRLRSEKPIVLVQFPHDEYGVDNRCSAAGIASIHIDSRGGVEPCPFAPVSCENIRNGGLTAAIRSPFLKAIREHHDLLTRKRFACALFEHLPEIQLLERQMSPMSDPREKAHETA